MIPNFKSMKESCTNLTFAVAAGAALEYGTELWTCVDLWYRQSFPGHSAEAASPKAKPGASGMSRYISQSVTGIVRVSRSCPSSESGMF